MSRNPDIKDVLIEAVNFRLFRIFVGLLVLSGLVMVTSVGAVIAGRYRWEVLIFCVGILPLPVFLVLHVCLSRISWKRFNHGLYYRTPPLFFLLPVALISTIALSTVMKRNGNLDGYYNWQARNTYVGWLPGSVDCVNTAVSRSGSSQNNLLELKGDPETAIEHLRDRLIGRGFNETDEAPYVGSNELPDWWRSRRRDDGAMMLRFEHPDMRVIGVWRYPDSDSVYVEVSRRN